MLLELTGNAMLCNNFDRFALCFHLPHTIETADNKRVLKTKQDLRNVFENVLHDMRTRQVTALVRYCEVAEYRTDTRIEATHISHMMSGDLRVVDPFPVFSVLEFVDGHWQIMSSQYAVDNQTTVGRAIARPAQPDTTNAEAECPLSSENKDIT